MENKHTPGPWKAHKLPEKIGFAEWEIHFTDDGECVAEVVHEEANAKLIAAAPELLEALQEVIKNAPDQFHIPTWDKVLSAIKKATE